MTTEWGVRWPDLMEQAAVSEGHVRYIKDKFPEVKILTRTVTVSDWEEED